MVGRYACSFIVTVLAISGLVAGISVAQEGPQLNY